ncbi:carbohydrate ABC transporter permease [Rhodococcus jostii]|uniref:carbohydrate ABC transporter permease n=1 Tax=Rhodococcus jostii TaxID=132919 RepID=UPI0036579230
MTSTAHTPQAAPARAFSHRAAPRADRGHRAKRALTGWLFVLPAAAMYTVFVLRPLLTTLWYSLYNWDGISVGSWVGLGNYGRVLTDPQLLSSIGHAFFLIVFFTVFPVIGGLLVAALLQEIRIRGLGTMTRTLLFLPQIIPGAAAAVAWVWMFSTNGTVNQLLSAVGLGGITRSWLGDFDWALPAVGIIGTWLGLGFCTILLMAGIGKIDIAIYEAARIDGAGFFSTFRYVTVPALRAEIGVCVTVTIIAALASFDIVFMSTQGGPGYATTVPGVQIYQLGFTESRVGLASALAVVLTGLILLVILPIQRFFREK